MPTSQELADAAPAVLRASPVAEIPASDFEVGAEGGQATVIGVENLFGRAEANWHTASIEENTEILGRRLFNPPAATFARRRKRTVTAFGDPMGQWRRVPAGVPLGPPPAPDARRPPGAPEFSTGTAAIDPT